MREFGATLFNLQQSVPAGFIQQHAALQHFAAPDKPGIAACTTALPRLHDTMQGLQTESS